MAKDKAPLQWVRLDNAAKIYPAARRRNWSSIYRLSVTLTQPVDTPVLQNALEVTVKRFPTIAARLRKGMFWYYLEQVRKAPSIHREYSYPLTYMSPKEMRRCALRVIVHENRIALEFFHALTDGTGAMIFLKTLTAEYLQQKYGVETPAQLGVLDRLEQPKQEELEDSFLKYAGPVPASRKGTTAWRLWGTPQTDGFLHLTCFQLSVQEVLKKAKEYDTSLTVFLSGVMMKALLQLQEEKMPAVQRRERIKLMIPVNLRRLFPSQTLRNFSMYTVPELDSRLGEYTLEEILRIIYHKIGGEVTPKHMASVISANVRAEVNPAVRLVPLPVKNLIMKIIFDNVGQKQSCMSFSNLGAVQVPEAMKPYVTRMDFVLGAQADSAYNCGMLSYGDTLYINFIRKIRDPELERQFFEILRDLGLSVTVESNRSGKEGAKCFV